MAHAPARSHKDRKVHKATWFFVCFVAFVAERAPRRVQAGEFDGNPSSERRGKFFGGNRYGPEARDRETGGAVGEASRVA